MFLVKLGYNLGKYSVGLITLTESNFHYFFTRLIYARHKSVTVRAFKELGEKGILYSISEHNFELRLSTSKYLS